MTERIALTDKGRALIAAIDAQLVDPHGDLQRFEEFWRLYTGTSPATKSKNGNIKRTTEFWKEIRGWNALATAIIALIVAILT